MAAKRKPKDAQRQWRRVDLHLHTPASSDFQETDTTYLDILQKAETRGLDMIAFTDHNSIAGYTAMLSDVEQSDPALKPIPVIIVSGLDAEERCMQAGADAFMLKPYSPSTLLDNIKKLVK